LCISFVVLRASVFAGRIATPYLDLASGYSSHQICLQKIADGRSRLPVGHRMGSAASMSGEEVQKKNIVRHLKLERYLHGDPLDSKELSLNKPSFPIDLTKTQSPMVWREFDPLVPNLVVDIVFERILHQSRLQQSITRSRPRGKAKIDIDIDIKLQL
jgi:hypothetical protein